MATTTYDGYRITELRRYATEYKIVGRSKMTGDELLAAVREVWTAERDAQQAELLASTDVKPGTLLRHKSSGYVIRVLTDVWTWEPYGALVVDAEYVSLIGSSMGTWGPDRDEEQAAYVNECEQRRRESGELPKHPLYQYEAYGVQAEAEAPTELIASIRTAKRFSDMTHGELRTLAKQLRHPAHSRMTWNELAVVAEAAEADGRIVQPAAAVDDEVPVRTVSENLHGLIAAHRARPSQALRTAIFKLACTPLAEAEARSVRMSDSVQVYVRCAYVEISRDGELLAGLCGAKADERDALRSFGGLILAAL